MRKLCGVSRAHFRILAAPECEQPSVLWFVRDSDSMFSVDIDAIVVTSNMPSYPVGARVLVAEWIGEPSGLN